MTRLSWTSFERACRFALGAGLIVHEALQDSPAQWEVLVACLALLSLPDAYRLDRWLGRQDERTKTPTDEVKQ